MCWGSPHSTVLTFFQGCGRSWCQMVPVQLMQTWSFAWDGQGITIPFVHLMFDTSAVMAVMSSTLAWPSQHPQELLDLGPPLVSAPAAGCSMIVGLCCIHWTKSSPSTRWLVRVPIWIWIIAIKPATVAWSYPSPSTNRESPRMLGHQTVAVPGAYCALLLWKFDPDAWVWSCLIQDDKEPPASTKWKYMESMQEPVSVISTIVQC